MNYHQDTKNLNFQGFALPVEWLTHRNASEEIHLAIVDLPLIAAQESILACLNDAERDEANRMQSAGDREHFVARRAFQRCFAANLATSNTSLAEFPLSRNAAGAPSSPALPGWSVSFSSTNAIAVGAASPNVDVGVDAELIRRVENASALAERFFAREEVQELAALSPAEQETGFLRLWSAKEACLKLIGHGMVYGPERILIQHTETTHYAVVPPAELGTPERWHVQGFELRTDHIITLATRKR